MIVGTYPTKVDKHGLKYIMIMRLHLQHERDERDDTATSNDRIHHKGLPVYEKKRENTMMCCNTPNRLYTSVWMDVRNNQITLILHDFLKTQIHEMIAFQ